jgi:hypothetical protein
MDSFSYVDHICWISWEVFEWNLASINSNDIEDTFNSLSKNVKSTMSVGRSIQTNKWQYYIYDCFHSNLLVIFASLSSCPLNYWLEHLNSYYNTIWLSICYTLPSQTSHFFVLSGSLILIEGDLLTPCAGLWLRWWWLYDRY